MKKILFFLTTFIFVQFSYAQEKGLLDSYGDLSRGRRRLIAKAILFVVVCIIVFIVKKIKAAKNTKAAEQK